MKELNLRRSFRIGPGLSSHDTKKMDPNRLFKENETLTKNRGQMINIAIVLERRLERILRILFRSDLFNVKDFDKDVLEERNLSFNDKFQILRELSPSHGLIKKDKDDWKKFRQLLSDVIYIRNGFAHGEVQFDEDGTYLRFMGSNEEKIEKLDEVYWDKVEETFNQASQLSLSLMMRIAGYNNRN